MMLSGDIITLAIILVIDLIILISLFFLPVSPVRSNLYRLGFTLGIISSSGILITLLVCVMSSREGWNYTSSIPVIFIICLPFITVWCTKRWVLTGSVVLALEALVLVVLPYGVQYLVEMNHFSNIIYQLLGGVLVLSGILLLHSWRTDLKTTPEKKCSDMRFAGLITGLMTVIILTPIFISSTYSYALNEERESAVILLVVLLAIFTGYGISWKSPCIGGWVLMVAGILDIFILFVIGFNFPWKLPLLADIVIVSLLPTSSGILLILYDREKGRIYMDYMISSVKFFRK
ncbi:MAG: hypothetical protein JSU58_08775 [Dehalococcoidales bacterium]|nr:MAG: hypothetical protein JSU58_08775 [Dehalococcoidales bacterium]